MFDRQAWLALGVLCGLLSQPALAEDAPDSRASRLGFKFDQRAHDAAVAADEARNRTRDEPLPPDVVRLPRLQVTTKALPRSTEMLTPKGRIHLAEERYETPLYRAVIGPLEAVASFLNNPLGGWAPNAPEALALYEDDERLRRRQEMSDLLDLAALADAAKRSAAKPKPKPGSSK